MYIVDSRFPENSDAITKLLFMKAEGNTFSFKGIIIHVQIAVNERQGIVTTASTLEWDTSPSKHCHGSFGQDMSPFIHLVSVRECREKVSCLWTQ